MKRSLSSFVNALNARIGQQQRLELEAKEDLAAPAATLGASLEKAKVDQQEILASTVNAISHVMGKMNWFSSQRALEPHLQPEFVFSSQHGLGVKPLEGRYLKIPLEIESEVRGWSSMPAEAPLVVCIAKHTAILDDDARGKAGKRVSDADF